MECNGWKWPHHFFIQLVFHFADQICHTEWCQLLLFNYQLILMISGRVAAAELAEATDQPATWAPGVRVGARRDQLHGDVRMRTICAANIKIAEHN